MNLAILLDRGITDHTVRGRYKAKGSERIQEKDVWALLDSICKATFDDSPWTLLLAHYGCYRNAPQQIAPCPCVWRRPAVGAQSHAELKEYRWDWRSCKKERGIRLALSHREPEPIIN